MPLVTLTCKETEQPTAAPTLPTGQPSEAPTSQPSGDPTLPTEQPSECLPESRTDGLPHLPHAPRDPDLQGDRAAYRRADQPAVGRPDPADGAAIGMSA